MAQLVEYNTEKKNTRTVGSIPPWATHKKMDALLSVALNMHLPTVIIYVISDRNMQGQPVKVEHKR